MLLGVLWRGQVLQASGGKSYLGAFQSCSYFLANCCVCLACSLISSVFWHILEPFHVITELFRILILFLPALLLFSCSFISPYCFRVTNWWVRMENAFTEDEGLL